MGAGPGRGPAAGLGRSPWRPSPSPSTGWIGIWWRPLSGTCSCPAGRSCTSRIWKPASIRRRFPYPAVPHAAMDQLVRHYIEPVRRAGRGVLPAGHTRRRGGGAHARGSSGPRRHVVPGGQALERTSDGAGWGCSRCRSRLRTCSARAAPPIRCRTCVSCCGRCPRRTVAPNASRAPRSSSGERTPPSRESGSRRHEPQRRREHRHRGAGAPSGRRTRRRRARRAVRAAEDAEGLRQRPAAGPGRLLVIGAGFTGCEVASACHELDLQVTVLSATRPRCPGCWAR